MDPSTPVSLGRKSLTLCVQRSVAKYCDVLEIPSQNSPISLTVPTTPSHGLAGISYTGHQSFVASPPPNIPRTGERPLRRGVENNATASGNLPWGPTVSDGNRVHLSLSQGQSQGYYNHDPTPPVQSHRAPNSTPDGSQNCMIPGCPLKAYYNYADREQTEYCGQGHELQAIETGLAGTCVMCKGRPRRMGELVCGRTCREQERLATQVHGYYYGVEVTRREPRRPGA
ncbi:hypothetical protein F5148DRAFT_1167740 [Russula earlei]|uniref:Uncharacterized protein n=1 Tax=Russula earlei TaxID=71964 RepID=A0ACC0ULK3_9AGAM|nr:hypothetical protein F5148DRAFT_1167740 [Russula earlei]